MSEVIRAAAKKWFYESFDCDLLERMERAGLIAQAEGFSISVMAELELEMESAFQSELAALREENRLLNHDIASFLETTARVCELLGIDTNDARHAEGKPSDVLFSHATALQQRLADAERRYRGLQKLTPYKFRKIQDASTTDGIDILYFHADRFDALLDAAITKPEEAKS